VLFPDLDSNQILISCTDQTTESDVTLLTAGIGAWAKEVTK